MLKKERREWLASLAPGDPVGVVRWYEGGHVVASRSHLFGTNYIHGQGTFNADGAGKDVWAFPWIVCPDDVARRLDSLLRIARSFRDAAGHLRDIGHEDADDAAARAERFQAAAKELMRNNLIVKPRLPRREKP